MLSYAILFTIICLVFIIPKKYFEKYGITILMIIFAVFYGIRNNVAVDDQNYIEMFSIFSKTLENAMTICPDVELVFKVICRILGILHLNYKALFLLYSSLSFTFLGLFLKKIKLGKKELLIFTMSFLAIGFFTYMIIMRQFLAISIALYGIASATIDKKYKKGVMLIIISTLFHSSTIIILILLPLFLYNIKIDYKIKILLLVIVIILGETGVMNEIIALISHYFKYGKYALDNTNKVFGGSGIIHYLLLIIYILQYIIINKNKKLRKEQNTNVIDAFLQKGEYIYLLLFFTTINSGFAIRLSYLYLVFMCFIFVTLTRTIDNKKLIVMVTIFAYIITITIIGKNMIEQKDTTIMQNDFSIDFFNKNRRY